MSDGKPVSTKPKLFLRNGRVVVSSLAVAEQFGKSHKNVLRAIELTRSQLLGGDRLKSEPISASVAEDGGRLKSEPSSPLLAVGAAQEFLATFCSNHYELSDFVDSRNRRQPMYFLTEEGFNLIAMGFTGEAALLWKIRYISAFSLLRTRMILESQAERALKALKPPGVFEHAESFLKAYYAVDADLGTANLLWWFVKQYEANKGSELEGRPVEASYREISYELEGNPSKTGVPRCINRLVKFGLLEQHRLGSGVSSSFSYELKMDVVKAFMAKGVSFPVQYLPGSTGPDGALLQ